MYGEWFEMCVATFPTPKNGYNKGSQFVSNFRVVDSKYLDSRQTSRLDPEKSVEFAAESKSLEEKVVIESATGTATR